MNLTSMRNNKTRRKKYYLVRKSPKSLNLMVSRYKGSIATFFIISPETRKILITLSHGLLILRIVIERNVIKGIFFKYLVYVSV